MRFLPDTNVWSELVRPQPNLEVVGRLAAEQAHLALAAPVWHELRYGVVRLPPSNRRDRLTEWLSGLAVRVPHLAYDLEAADWHAAERARLEAIGASPRDADARIAAIAATNGLTLVTANARDFAGFRGLAVADWR